MTITAFTNTQLGTVLIDAREIVAVGADSVPEGATIIDAQGLVLAPGLIDAGVFKADGRACHAGGITRVVLMPDQNPVLDNPAMIEFAWGATKPHLWVHPLAAATRGLEGRELAEIGLCQRAGAMGVATGRSGIADAGVMYRLLHYATGFGLVVVSHAEEAGLIGDAVATDGEFAARMGLAAAPAFAEALAVARDLRLAAATGARLHFRQVTTAESIDLVRQAKARGQAVTCGVTPAHFLLNEQSISGYRTFARFCPPLRVESDRLAVLAGLADGTIDIIASGHDPRSQEDKRLPFADAEPGMIGAETLLALSLSLVRDGRLSRDALLAKLTINPARIFGLPAGEIAVGQPADLMLFDEHAPWRIDAAASLASAANTPFDAMPTQGIVRLTMKGGVTVWRAA